MRRSPLLGKLYGDLDLPKGVRFAAVVRGDNKFYMKYDMEFEKDDRVLVYTYMARGSAVKKILGKGMPEL